MTAEREPRAAEKRERLEAIAKTYMNDHQPLAGVIVEAAMLGLSLEHVAREQAATEARRELLAKAREWAKNVVRDVPPVHIVNTDAVPTFKRRPGQCIDRAAVLLALEHAALIEESDIEMLANNVRYAGGNGTSDYWRGFNDGIDKLAGALKESDRG